MAALQADAAAARRVLRQPRSPRPRDTPRLWDARPIDSRPDDCWRCDVDVSADDLGLCPPCRQALSR